MHYVNEGPHKDRSTKVCVCVCVCLNWCHIDTDLCLVEQIKLSPHACTCFSMVKCVYFECVCVSVDCVWQRERVASWFLGQTLSFCACHILLSVAHTPSSIPHIPSPPTTSILALINSISQNGIRFITPHRTQRRETPHPHTHTAVSGTLPHLKLNFPRNLAKLSNILYTRPYVI